MLGPDSGHLYRSAIALYERGQLQGAIDLLCRLLGRDPEYAMAHALLATFLLQQRRLHAAALESQLALSLAPEEPYCHLAAAFVAQARLRYQEAHDHVAQALELDADQPDAHAVAGRLYLAEQKPGRARSAFEAALAIDPERVDALVGLGEVAFLVRDDARARDFAEQALRLSPRDDDALVLMGQWHLHRGEVAEARQHALWVLADDAMDAGALRLLTNIKARENWFLGFWWRFNATMSRLSEKAIVGTLIGLFLTVNAAAIYLSQMGEQSLSQGIQYVWLAFVLYTWIGPAIMSKLLKRELETVALKTSL